MNAALHLLFMTSILNFGPIDVGAQLEDDSVLSENEMVFTVDLGIEEVTSIIVDGTKELSRNDPTLKEIEFIEGDEHTWLVRHLYIAGFAVIKDETNMILRFNLDETEEENVLDFHLVESIDEKVLENEGSYRIRAIENGSTEVTYTAMTRYADKRRAVVFAIRNFSERMLKTTFSRMFAGAISD